MNTSDARGMQHRVYRAMKQDLDGFPQVGRSARALGVRIAGPHEDLPVFPGNVVRPATGGMSVVFDDPRSLPKFRRPRSLGGEGRDPVFAMDVTMVPSSLVVRPDRPPHALVEPADECLLGDYERALYGTRGSWRCVNV